MSSGLGPAVLAVTWAEFAAGSVLMVLRIYTNGFILHRWAPDFWWAFASFICAIFASIFLTIAVNYGIGSHFTPIPTSKSPDPLSELYQLIFTTFSILAIAFGKMAVIQFILQLEGTNKTRKWILHLCATANFLVSFVFIPLIWAQCDPVDKIWDPSIGGSCKGTKTYTMYAYFQGGFGATLDAALALYPAIMLWHLQVKRHVKLGLIFMFGFGIVAAITAIVKTLQIGTVKVKQDVTFHQGYLDIWASTNLWVVFIAGCIPTIRPILVRAIHAFTGKEENTTIIGNGYHHDTINRQINSQLDSESKSESARQARAYMKIYGVQSANGKGNRNGNGKRGNETESNETIVRPQGVIFLKQEYHVTYEESEDSLSEKGLARNESWNSER